MSIEVVKLRHYRCRVNFDLIMKNLQPRYPGMSHAILNDRTSLPYRSAPVDDGESSLLPMSGRRSVSTSDKLNRQGHDNKQPHNGIFTPCRVTALLSHFASYLDWLARYVPIQYASPHCSQVLGRLAAKKERRYALTLFHGVACRLFGFCPIR